MAKDEKPVPPVEPAPPAETPTITGFLEENPGERSAMRLISVITVSAAVVLALIVSVASLRGNADTATTVQMVTTLLGFGFGGKLLQKFTEPK